MPITERKLKKWRKEALILKETIPGYSNKVESVPYSLAIILFERILQLTQELLDQHLIRRGNGTKKDIKASKPSSDTG